MATWQQEIDSAINDRFDQLVAVRQKLHQFPELSGEERQTSFYLYQLLGEEGFDVRLGPEGRGVVADAPLSQESSDAGRLALRADIDALRIHDCKTAPYRSQNDGVMHACGHDAHTAIVLGAVTSLADLRKANKLPWPVPTRAIFQPAEETCRGAREMMKVGSLEGVSAILATHVDPSRPVGTVGVRNGVLTANCDEMIITITGRGGHAARPHEACDPIAAAVQLVNALYLAIPRVTDSQDAVVITIGQISGGDNANVIPEQVRLLGTIRTLDARVRETTFAHIRRLAGGIAQVWDTKIEVEKGMSAPSVRNDRRLTDLFRQSGAEVLGAAGVQEIPRPSMGSEDFAFYLEEVPGAMFRLGCASPRVGNSPLHSPSFDVDEEALRIGARLLARAAVYGSAPV